MPPLEVGDLDRPPAFRGPDHGAEHELQDGLLAEGIGNDLEPAAFLDEQTFEKIGRTGRPAMGDGQAQMRDAGLEVVLKAGHGAGIIGPVIGMDAGGQIAGDGPAGRLVGGRDAGLEVGSDIFRHLGRQVPHAVRQATLAERTGETAIDRLDDPRRPVRGNQQRIAQAPGTHILEER